MVSISLSTVWEPVLHVIVAHGGVLVRQCTTGTSAVKAGTLSFLLCLLSAPVGSSSAHQVASSYSVPPAITLFCNTDKFSVIPISPLENVNSGHRENACVVLSSLHLDLGALYTS